jgi:hypothetical protein
MMFQGKQKIPQYTGDIIVCLDKARPFSEVKGGREIIGLLANTKIKTSNVRLKHSSEQRVYSENEIAVPVAIFNPGTKAIEDDWTKTFCPITQREYRPMQRWWPKSIFKGSQKIGDIAEEIVIEYPRYIIKLHVNYAFTAISKEMFADIDAEEKVAEKKEEAEKEKISFSLVKGEGEESNIKNVELDADKISFDYKLTDSIPEKEYDRLLVQEKPRQAKSGIVKYVVGGLIAAALVTGLVFGIKYMVTNKSSKE